MDWDKYNEKTKPAMDFLRIVYRDNISELASLECAQAEEDIHILIEALEGIRRFIDRQIKELKEIK